MAISSPEVGALIPQAVKRVGVFNGCVIFLRIARTRIAIFSIISIFLVAIATTKLGLLLTPRHCGLERLGHC